MMPWVHSYRRYHFGKGDPIDVPMFPGTGAEIWFVQSGKLLIDGILRHDGLLCLRHECLILRQKDLVIFSIRLRAGALPFFAPREMTDIIDSFHPLSYIWGEPGARLSRHIQSCKNFREQCHVAGGFLRDICKAGRRFETMQRLSETVYEDSASFSIEAFSAHIRKHRSVISHGFHETQGVSIKYFHRLCRFERFIRDALYTSDTSLCNLSLQHGYYDQAHMNRDVKLMTGTSPVYLRQLCTSRLFYAARRTRTSV